MPNSESNDEPITSQPKRRRISRGLVERNTLSPSRQTRELSNGFTETIIMEQSRPSTLSGSALMIPTTQDQPHFPRSYSPPMTSKPVGKSAPTPPRPPLSRSIARAPQITLVLPDQSGNLDFDNLVSVSILKDSSLVTFFNFFRQRTGISNQGLDCLTFRHCFAGSSVKVRKSGKGSKAISEERLLMQGVNYQRKGSLIFGLRGVIQAGILRRRIMVGYDE
jgi:hypothetical protein